MKKPLPPMEIYFENWLDQLKAEEATKICE